MHFSDVIRGLLLAVLLATAGGASPPPTAGMPGQQPLVIEHVSIIDLVTGTIAADRTVVIRNGAIERIGGADLPAPQPALHIDATGCYLMPGLAEMHAHIPGQNQGNAYRDRVLFLYLAAGVTTVRGMLGEASHLGLRDDAASYRILAPRIFTSGPSFNGRSVNGADAARRMALAQHEAGYDFYKLHPGLTRAEYDALVASAAKTGLPFAGHVSVDVGLARTLQAGQATIDHLDGYMQALVPPDRSYDADIAGFFGGGLAMLADPARIAQVARETAEAGVWNVPTQTLIENIAGPMPAAEMAAWPEMRYMPADRVQQWAERKTRAVSPPQYDAASAQQFIALRRDLIRALHEAGAGLLLGSDAPQVFNVPGFAIHRELAVLVAAGLTPRDALLTGTANPAKFFGAEHVFGAVKEGLEADLLLLEADPTADIANVSRIAGVIARGRWLPRTEIDRRLAVLAQQ